MLPLYLAMIDTDEDRTKFAALYERYSRLMFYIARQILIDEQLSEDAVQEAFLRIAKNMHKVGDVSCPQTRNFSVIITRNVAITMKKQNAYDFETDIAALEYRTTNYLIRFLKSFWQNVSSSCRIYTETHCISITCMDTASLKYPTCCLYLLKQSRKELSAPEICCAE